MIEFFENLAYGVEEFFTTPLATAIGTVFLISSALLTVLLTRHFESK